MCKYLIGLLLLALLMSCGHSNSAESAFDNYIYRLSNVLGAERRYNELEGQALLERYPTHRQLIQNIAPLKINLLDFLKLSSCDLQRHIGKRNSNLGRVLQPSQRMFYEYTFIHLAEECLQQLDNASALFRVLSESVEAKRQQLSFIRWNATFASEEFSVLFSLSASPLGLKSATISPTQLYDALDIIAHYTQTDWLVASDEQKLEQAFSVVASSRRMGEIRHSLLLVQHALSQADVILESALLGRPLCFQQKPNKKSEILQIVFEKFYIGEIQPYISKLYQQADALFTRIDSLSGEYPDKPEAFTTFWETVFLSGNSEWRLFKRSIERHTHNWQQLLEQCGRLPTR